MFKIEKIRSLALKQQSQPSSEGFSLIETVIALVTLGICLAYAMPLFLFAKLNNSKSEIRTGALIVAQRVFDNIRAQPFTVLPNTDANVPIATNPQYLPEASNPAHQLALTKALGRQYQAKISYCENLNTDSTVCNTNYRRFKVEISYDGKKVYDLEGTYTKFE